VANQRPTSGFSEPDSAHASGGTALAGRPHRRHIDWAVDLCALAGSGDASGAAQDLLDRLYALVPYVGAALCAFDPVTRKHVTIANAGYARDVAGYLNEGFINSDPAYELMRKRPGYPLRWRDTPFDYEQSFSVEHVFRPAGYLEGMSAPLTTPDGRYTGVLHVSTDTRAHPSNHARETIHRLRSGVATIIDPLRRPAWMARFLEPTAHAVVVTAAGDVVPLPGRTPGPLLSPDSQLVARVVALQASGVRERRFLWEAPGHSWHRVRLTPLDAGVLVMEQGCSLPYGITPRELEVLTGIASGASNADMARTFVVAPRTIATHVEHLLEKLGCRSRAGCAAIAAAEGLLVER
jgi:DNA-binding CsgD family transcriptional regulator